MWTALKDYLQRSSEFRSSDCPQFFIADGERDREKAVTSSMISRWLGDTIVIVYTTYHLSILIGIKAHQTRKLSVSFAEMVGVF